METNFPNHPENEMREVFTNAIHAITQLRDRTISTVVSHSQQAREIEKLRQDFHDLQARMNSVVDEAQRYRTDLHAVITERDKYKRDADDNLALAQGYEKERDETRQRLNEAHSVSTSLGEELASEKRNHENTKTQLDRLNRSVEGLGQDRDYYRERYYEAKSQAEKNEKALKEANEKLSRLQDTFRSLFPETNRSVEATEALSAAKPVELPGQAPSFDTRHLDNPPEPVQEVPPVQSAGEYGADEHKPEEAKPTEEEIPWWKKAAQ